MFCVLNSLRVMLKCCRTAHKATTMRRVSSGHLYDDKSFAPADNMRQASLVCLPLRKAAVYAILPSCTNK